jgi:hypothetical protein
MKFQFHRVCALKNSDCFWLSIVFSKVNLEKVQERWWEAVFTDEPKISVRKIDPSRSITDLDDEAQAKIEELMYNEHQKRMGLPQSHEKVFIIIIIHNFRVGRFDVCFVKIINLKIMWPFKKIFRFI